jgi:hypothetical protein
VTTRPFNDQLRAVILAGASCEAGWRRFLSYLKTYGDFSTLIMRAQEAIVRSEESYLINDYKWLARRLDLPCALMDIQHLFNRGFRVRTDDCWRILEAYSIKPCQIVEKVKEAYKALSPSDRRRRTWAQRRKS